MSFQAPFVDAATSVDPVNRENTFISYYSYGSVLGLALDLSLRGKGLNLDDYMKQVWNSYGKTETPYTLENLQMALNTYAGNSFGDDFFAEYIYKSEMPDYAKLFKTVGIALSQDQKSAYFGAAISITDDLKGKIQSNPKMGSPAYQAGLDIGDLIKSINGKPFPNGIQFDAFIKQEFKPNAKVNVVFERNGLEKSTEVVLGSDPTYKIELVDKKRTLPSKNVLKNRKEWLKTE